MTKQQRILIVDDEPAICDIVAFNLERAGFVTASAGSASEALSLGIENYDLLLLDVMMNEMSGFELARLVKSSPATRPIPIIFMTAKDDEQDILQGFELGADDYIEKPFSVKELVARVKAVLGRMSRPSDVVAKPNELRHNTLVLNSKNYSLYVDDRPVSLTKLEFDLLKTFLTNKGHVLSREQLIKSAWPDKVHVSERTVDVSITRLRRKLGVYSNCIVTRTGFGYCFE